MGTGGQTLHFPAVFPDLQQKQPWPNPTAAPRAEQGQAGRDQPQLIPQAEGEGTESLPSPKIPAIHLPSRQSCSPLHQPGVGAPWPGQGWLMLQHRAPACSASSASSIQAGADLTLLCAGILQSRERPPPIHPSTQPAKHAQSPVRGSSLWIPARRAEERLQQLEHP